MLKLQTCTNIHASYIKTLVLFAILSQSEVDLYEFFGRFFSQLAKSAKFVWVLGTHAGSLPLF